MKKKRLVRLLMRQVKTTQIALEVLRMVHREYGKELEEDEEEVPQRVPGGHPKQDLKFRREVQ